MSCRGSSADRTARFLFPAALLAAAFLVSCTSIPRGRGEETKRDVDSLYAEGLERLSLGDPRGAIPPLRQAADLAPTEGYRADIEFQLGRCYLATRDPRRAIEHFSLARERARSETRLFDIWKGMGDAHYVLGDYTQASTAYRECLRLERDPALLDEIYYKLAVGYRKAGDEANAELYRSRVRRYVPSAGEPRYESLARGSTPSRGRSTEPGDSTLGLRDVLTRADWGAAPTRSNHDPMTRIYRLTVHHSAQYCDLTSRASVAEHIHQIQEHHMRSSAAGGNGWADIGYHFVVDRTGRVWEGRPLRYQGAHAGNSDLNRGNVGIVLLGDFNSQRVTREQENALRALIAFLREKYGIGPDRIYTHQELKGTECPGRDLQGLVDRIRREGRRGAGVGSVAGHGEIRHSVRRGETLFGIAKRYGVSVADLKQANANVSGDEVRVGESLAIPAR